MVSSVAVTCLLPRAGLAAGAQESQAAEGQLLEAWSLPRWHLLARLLLLPSLGVSSTSGWLSMTVE